MRRRERSFLSGIQSEEETEKRLEERSSNPAVNLYRYAVAYIAYSTRRSEYQKELEGLRELMVSLQRGIEVELSEDSEETPSVLRVTRGEYPGRYTSEARKDEYIFFADGISVRFQEVETQRVDSAQMRAWLAAELAFLRRVKNPSQEQLMELRAYERVQDKLDSFTSVSVSVRCTPDSPELREQRKGRGRRRRTR